MLFLVPWEKFRAEVACYGAAAAVYCLGSSWGFALTPFTRVKNHDGLVFAQNSGWGIWPTTAFGMALLLATVLLWLWRTDVERRLCEFIKGRAPS